jgi:hypothetical protein
MSLTSIWFSLTVDQKGQHRMNWTENQRYFKCHKTDMFDKRLFSYCCFFIYPRENVSSENQQFTLYTRWDKEISCFTTRCKLQRDARHTRMKGMMHFSNLKIIVSIISSKMKHIVGQHWVIYNTCIEHRFSHIWKLLLELHGRFLSRVTITGEYFKI